MKLHADVSTRLNAVTAYGAGFIEVNQVRHHGNLLLLPDAPAQSWQVGGFEALRADHFAALLPFAPDVVLLGTGRRQRFAPPQLTAPLAAAGIGVESMDTAAACRTYNILMNEGRRVLAAMLQDK